MRFIIDAQLPFALSKYLGQKGFDVIHTDDLPNKEYTTDNEIREISVNQNRILSSKLVNSLIHYTHHPYNSVSLPALSIISF